jgi:hypothetical protein
MTAGDTTPGRGQETGEQGDGHVRERFAVHVRIEVPERVHEEVKKRLVQRADLDASAEWAYEDLLMDHVRFEHEVVTPEERERDRVRRLRERALLLASELGELEGELKSEREGSAEES